MSPLQTSWVIAQGKLAGNDNLIQNSQAVKEECGSQKGCGEKRCEIAAKNLPELSLLKFLPLTYHHSHFLAATLDFTSFFTIAFLRAAHFFYSLAGLD